MTKTKTVAEGLRELADWFEAHPDQPPPNVNRFIHGWDGDVAQQFTSAMEAFAPSLKKMDDSYISFERMFGPVKFSINFERQAICPKRVVWDRPGNLSRSLWERFEKEVVSQS